MQFTYWVCLAWVNMQMFHGEEAAAVSKFFFFYKWKNEKQSL
jgi:hypothetical protein